MPTAGTEGLVAMPWGIHPGQLIAFGAPMGLGAGLGRRGIEVWQWGLCGRALVPTQTFPVEVFGPVWDYFLSRQSCGTVMKVFSCCDNRAGQSCLLG